MQRTFIVFIAISVNSFTFDADNRFARTTSLRVLSNAWARRPLSVPASAHKREAETYLSRRHIAWVSSKLNVKKGPCGVESGDSERNERGGVFGAVCSLGLCI